MGQLENYNTFMYIIASILMLNFYRPIQFLEETYV